MLSLKSTFYLLKQRTQKCMFVTGFLIGYLPIFWVCCDVTVPSLTVFWAVGCSIKRLFHQVSFWGLSSFRLYQWLLALFSYTAVIKQQLCTFFSDDSDHDDNDNDNSPCLYKYSHSVYLCLHSRFSGRNSISCVVVEMFLFFCLVRASVCTEHCDHALFCMQLCMCSI